MKHTVLLNNLKLIPVYIVFIPIWAMAGLTKLFGGGVPAHFEEMFSKTFIAQFPGTTIAFYKVAILEVLALVLFVVSLIRREFMPKKSKAFLNWAIFVSLFNFSILGFGLRVAGNNEMATQLFMFFGATAVIWLYTDSVHSTK